jgi:hypothetical protein
MNAKSKRLGGAAFFAAVLAAYWAGAAGPAAPGGPDGLSYDTSCSIAEADWVEGFVTNQSVDTAQIGGQSRFVFQRAGSMSRPEIVVFVNALIPPSQTARVARARLTFQLRPGESCSFQIESIRKAP